MIKESDERNLTPPTKHQRNKNDDVTKYKEKAKSSVIRSRIRERDKKNAEYYVGDYFETVQIKRNKIFFGYRH